MSTLHLTGASLEASTNVFGNSKSPQYRHSMLCRTSDSEEFYDHYPSYIVDKFLLLLDNVFEGQTGPHIDSARQCFESFRSNSGKFREFRDRVSRVLTGILTFPFSIRLYSLYILYDDTFYGYMQNTPYYSPYKLMKFSCNK